MIFIKSVDSTNTYLKNMAENGAPDRIAVVAETQKKGRGRLSRSFFSPPDTGLYMSILGPEYLMTSFILGAISLL